MPRCSSCSGCGPQAGSKVQGDTVGPSLPICRKLCTNAGPACRHMQTHASKAWTSSFSLQSKTLERNRHHRVRTKDRTGPVATGPFTSRTVAPRTFLPPGPFFHRTVPFRTLLSPGPFFQRTVHPRTVHPLDSSHPDRSPPELFIPWTVLTPIVHPRTVHPLDI